MRFLDLLARSLGGRSGRSPRSAPTPAIAASPVSSTTFAVSEVVPDTHPLPEMAYRDAVESQLAPPPSPVTPEERRLALGDEAEASRLEPVDPRPVEACAQYRGRLLSGVYTHPFVTAAHLAFAHHRPLTMSPDMIWLMIMQGFAAHVNHNAESLRSRFVTHKGQASIKIRRDDFVKGSPENPWEEVFAEFSRAVRDHIGSETHDILMPGFSTTGEVERAAAEVVLLEAMQRYFDFEFTTFCGIPSITLEGVAEDWDQLILRTRALAQFGLEWWVNVLVPVLEEFGRAARGEVRTAFWRSLYKENDDSGGPFLTGWVTAFFPYLVNLDLMNRDGDSVIRGDDLVFPGDDLVILGGARPMMLNRFLTSPDWGHWSDESSPRLPRGSGVTFDQLPSGLSRVPFRWMYLWRSYRMEFLAGFVGVRQDGGTLALRPEIGWAVREAASV